MAAKCHRSLLERCDCRNGVHLRSHTAIYDSHRHYQSFDLNGFNEEKFFQQLDHPTIRQLILVNKNHKFYLWNNVKRCFFRNTKIYNTYGIHPKYIPENNIPAQLNELEKIIVNEKESRRIVAIGECGIDETSRFSFEIQLTIFQAEVILAREFHLPLVLHGRGTRTFETMYNVLEKELVVTNPVQWHCVNARSNLFILDEFINKFENSFLSLNGSSMFDEDVEKQKSFQHWLKKHTDFLHMVVF